MNMKITMGVLIMLFSINSYAGDYDGIWQTTFPGGVADNKYITINQNANQLIMVFHGLTPLLRTAEWIVDSGIIEGNVAQMQTLISEPITSHCIAQLTVEFGSLTEATISYHSVSGQNCPPLAGLQVDIKKIF